MSIFLETKIRKRLLIISSLLTVMNPFFHFQHLQGEHPQHGHAFLLFGFFFAIYFLSRTLILLFSNSPVKPHRLYYTCK